MNSTKNWWQGDIEWSTPAGQLLDKFMASLPPNRPFHIVIYGSALLQLTVDHQLLSSDVDIFSENDDDLSGLIAAAELDKAQGRFYIESGYPLSFRTSPMWQGRAKTVQRGAVKITLPHPLDILIGKLGRLEAKDLAAFRRVIELTGHPTAGEFQRELQNAVDLFRPAFDEDSPNLFPENAVRLWREIFHSEIDLRRDIIAPALERRRAGYGETPPDYKFLLDN